MTIDVWKCKCCGDHCWKVVKCKVVYRDIETDEILFEKEQECCPSCFEKCNESLQYEMDILICDECGARTDSVSAKMFVVKNETGNDGIYVRCPYCGHVERLEGWK